jgi:hypothetical protein
MSGAGPALFGSEPPLPASVRRAFDMVARACSDLRTGGAAVSCWPGSPTVRAHAAHYTRLCSGPVFYLRSIYIVGQTDRLMAHEGNQSAHCVSMASPSALLSFPVNRCKNAFSCCALWLAHDSAALVTVFG